MGTRFELVLDDGGGLDGGDSGAIILDETAWTIRFAPAGVSLDLDGFRALDRERRQLITAVEKLKAERNKASEEIARLKKQGKVKVYSRQEAFGG